MAKHAVPKRKTSKSKSKSRYGSFKTKTLTKLSNQLNLVVCKVCGAKHLAHRVCMECGFYRGRQVFAVSKGDDNVTTIKA